MKEKDFKNVEVTDRFGERVTIIEINENVATVIIEGNRLHHITNLFYKGKSVAKWLGGCE
jgi:hypothetical protein